MYQPAAIIPHTHPIVQPGHTLPLSREALMRRLWEQHDLDGSRRRG